MKLVSLLCLILGTACITTEGTPIDPQTRDESAVVDTNAPDAEQADQPTRVAIPPNLTIGSEPAALADQPALADPTPDLPARCTIEDDCAADETCLQGACVRLCGSDDACGVNGACVHHVCVAP